MFVILLKWWKRRVGGKDYRLCFYRKVNIRLMTPNCAPSCYKAFRSARDEVMRLIRSAKVGSLILPTMLAPLFEHAIRSPFSDRLPSAEYITLIGSGWCISLDFNLGQVDVTITTIGTGYRDLICGWIRPIQQGATLRVRNGVLGSPACSSFAELNRLAALTH